MTDSNFSSGSAASSVARPPESIVPVRPGRDPETVINPERRSSVEGTLPANSPVGSTGRSSIVRLLFPPEGEPPAPGSEPPLSVTLGHFQIVERIRSGGMGAVFRATDTRLQRTVALKVLPPTFSRDPQVVQRFKNEAQSAAQLDHENVARVFYIGEDQGLHFIAFEFVVGTNVRELIHQQGRMSVAESVNYVLQIAAALVHTASQGIVHRDIKPSNIIITPAGRAKLVDLGLARKENRDDQAADLTMAGTTLGTFDYISPEQARDPRIADIRSDIYSLGCTIYHMLTGEPPYPEGTVLQKLLQHQGDDAPDPALKNSTVPEDLSVVIRKMMAKDPRRRYQNAEQLVRDLMLVAGAMGLRSVSPEGLVWLSSRQRESSFWERHLAWIGTAAALFLIVAYLEYSGSQGQRGQSNSENIHRSGSRQNATNLQQSESTGKIQPDPAGKSTQTGSRLTRPSSLLHALKEFSAAPDFWKGVGEQLPDADLSMSETTDEESPGPFKPFELADGSRPQREGSFTIGPPGMRRDGAVDPFGIDSVGSRLKNALRSRNDRTRTGSDPAENGVASTVPTNDAASSTTRPPLTERTNGAETGATALEDDGIFVLGRDGAQSKRFDTLEAACSDPSTRDGAVIELRFDGRRIENSLRITRKFTIRAAKGRHPIIEFHPKAVVTDGTQVRAILMPSGSLDVEGVELSLIIDDTVTTERWALFSVEKPERLRLQGVTVSIVNPRLATATVIDLKPSAGAMMPDMPMVGGAPRPPLEIELVDSLIRGQSDLFLARTTEPARLNLRQTVVALQGALLSERGNAEILQENSQIELRLEHVTAALGDGLVRLDSGSTPRKLLPVHVYAFDSIFTNPGFPGGGLTGNSVPALVSMSGNYQPRDFEALLSWNGKNNIYDRFEKIWLISSTEGIGSTVALDFAQWRKRWEGADANSTAVTAANASIWKDRQWNRRPANELTASDFQLDRESNFNPAVAGASNSTDAGADLEKSPRPADSADARE